MKTDSKLGLILLLALAALPAFTATAVPGEGGKFAGCLYYGNGRPAIGVNVQFYASAPGLQSGYHPHDTGFGRPNVIFNGPTTQVTGPDGCAWVDVLLPYYAGVYTIYAYGDGLSNHTQITVSLAGLNNPLQTAAHFGLGGLSHHFDPNHGGWQWYGKLSTNSKLLATSDKWYAKTANFYGPMYLYRYGLPNGGDLDNGPFPLWAATMADAHISGIEFDIDNPLVVNGNIPQNDMLVAITQACGFTGKIAPGYGYTTIEHAYVWHVYCP
jgi:hypothetical protein